MDQPVGHAAGIEIIPQAAWKTLVVVERSGAQWVGHRSFTVVSPAKRARGGNLQHPTRLDAYHPRPPRIRLSICQIPGSGHPSKFGLSTQTSPRKNGLKRNGT